MPGRRKLLFYTHALMGGGAERVFARLASGFAARNDDVIFVVDFEAQENLRFVSSSVDLRVLPQGHARATYALSRILRHEKPAASLSAIGVSNIKHSAAAILAGRLGRAILTYHGFYENEPQLLSNIGYRLTPVLSRIAGATVAVSDHLRDDLFTRFSADKNRTLTVLDPAAPEPFPDAVSIADRAARPPVVINIGRLAPDKDQITLLRAFARLPHPDAQLIILGEGPERPRLEAEARRLGVEKRVFMPGFVQEVDTEIRRASCFALPSRHETFSLALVEALAHGLPAVVTNSGGPVEIVNDPAIGEIVPIGDVAAMAKALENQLDAPGDPEIRRRRAREFSLETALDAYDAVIRAVDR